MRVIDLGSLLESLEAEEKKESMLLRGIDSKAENLSLGRMCGLYAAGKMATELATKPEPSEWD